MPPCPPHLAHTASRVSSSTCLPSFHLIFLSSDLFAAACLFSCFFPYSGSFSCFPAFHRTSSSAYNPAKYARISPPCLVKEQGIRTISFRLFARFSWNSPRIRPADSGNVFSACPSASSCIGCASGVQSPPRKRRASEKSPRIHGHRGRFFVPFILLLCAPALTSAALCTILYTVNHNGGKRHAAQKV